MRGEAGRGFSIVASEVKSLAGQTANATGEIGAQIRAIQQSTEMSVEAMGGISTAIQQLDEVMSAINASVVEQDAATGEIAGAIQQVSSSAVSIAEHIDQASVMASETRDVAGNMLDSARKLAEEAADLRERAPRLHEQGARGVDSCARFNLHLPRIADTGRRPSRWLCRGPILRHGPSACPCASLIAWRAAPCRCGRWPRFLARLAPHIERRAVGSFTVQTISAAASDQSSGKDPGSPLQRR